MVALSRCLGSLALVVAGCECARVSRKRTDGAQESNTKVIAGVPVLDFYSEEHPVPGSWIALFKEGTTDADIISFCADRCSLMGHPSSGGVAFAQVHGTNEMEMMVSAQAQRLELVEPEQLDHMLSEEGEVGASGVASWGLERIGVPSRALTGKGQTIYVQDTGVRSTHQDFGGRASGAIDLTIGGLTVCDEGSTTCAGDAQGHGTHCAGSAAGTTYGVASEATVKAVKTLSDQGSGARSWQMAAIDWVATSGVIPSVISMSLGGNGRDEAYTAAINAATDAGITIVVAAGNSRADACNFSPAFAERAITVGASDSTNNRAGYSNYGTCNDIMAPGSDIVSASNRGDSGSTSLSGTSMACPHVSGAAALLLESDPSLDRDGIFDALRDSARTDFIGRLKNGDPNLFLWVGADAAPAPEPTPAPVPTPAPCVNGCNSRYCYHELCQGCDYC